MAEYEFNADQNKTISGLGSAMRGVGAFFVVVGLLNLLAGALLVAAIYRNNIPPNVMAQVPAEMKAQFEALPPQDHLWGLAINAGMMALLHLLIGGWTRSAGGAFLKIAQTQNSDISLLMTGLGSLRSMYGLIYTLLLIFMLLVVAGLAMSLYAQWKLMQ